MHSASLKRGEVDMEYVLQNPDEVEVKSKGDRCTLLVVISLLGVALVVAVIIVIGLAVGLGVERSKSSGGSNDCTSPTCIALSNQILSSLDQSVDPCDDFYAFACNGFVQETILPFGTGRVNGLAHPRTLNIERIRVLMESGDDMSVEAIGKAITYYRSCLQGDSLEVAVQTFQQLLQNLGGWPLVGVNQTIPWNLNNQNGFLTEKLYGSPAFFAFAPFPSPRNSSRTLVTVLQSGLTIPVAALYEEEAITTIIKQKIMLPALTLVNPSIAVETYSDAIDDMVNFEREIARIYNFNGQILDSLVERSTYLTFDELTVLFPRFDWQENFQYYANLANINYDQSTPVNVLATDYLASLNSLLERTDPIVLENYAKWQFLYTIMPFMSTEFADIAFTINRLSQPDVLMPQRYVTCVNNAEQLLPLPIARAFTEVYLPPEIRGNLSIILAELETAMRGRINSREWLDDSTRQRALSKLSSIKELVAYPDRILNNTFLNDYHSLVCHRPNAKAVLPLNVSMTAPFLRNHVSSRFFSILKSIGGVDKINNRSLYYFPVSPPPTTTNAAYFPTLNQIYIFEGILDTPVFQSSWPDYFKFGTIGYVVGHEYTHGFDNSGRRFNEVGNVENWWSTSSETEFKSRAQCFIDQYSQYSIPVGPVNGTLTLGENIADNGGLIAAYQAYKNRLRETRSREPTLPGLSSYSPDQLFFIGSAQIWCQVATNQTQRLLLLSDVHSPDPIRPLGTLSNSREFSTAFNCPVGSKMNPMRKCELW